MNPVNSLPIEEEKALIARAKAGDNEATEILTQAYRPALVAASSRNEIYLDQNERDSACYGAFVEALHLFDESRHARLSVIIKNLLAKELAIEKSTAEAVSVPDRTISRYHRIMTKAGDDIFKALELAPKNDMNASTFLQVHNILRDSVRLEDLDVDGLEAFPITKAPQEAPEAVKSKVRAVFATLEDDNDLSPVEVQVLSVHFGLAGNCHSESKSFAETAFELDMPVKEVKLHHINAIRKARKRLCNSNQ